MSIGSITHLAARGTGARFTVIETRLGKISIPGTLGAQEAQRAADSYVASVERRDIALVGQIGSQGPTVKVDLRGPEGKRTIEAILDSGAARSVIDRREAKRVGAPIVGSYTPTTPCGTCKMDIVRVELVIGGVRYGDAEILAGPSTLLGQDFLAQGLLVCDGPARRFSFTGKSSRAPFRR